MSNQKVPSDTSVAAGILEGLLQARDHAKGQNNNVRATRITVEPLPRIDHMLIKEIRRNTGLSQVLFAKAIGVSPKSIEAWECGRNQPQGPALRILEMVRRDPDLFRKQSIVQQ